MVIATKPMNDGRLRVFADGLDTGLVFRKGTPDECELTGGNWCLERPDDGEFDHFQMAVLHQLAA